MTTSGAGFSLWEAELGNRRDNAELVDQLRTLEQRMSLSRSPRDW
jgi:hypothetical protein